MKHLLPLLAFLTLAPLSGHSVAQVSVSIGQPGFHGRIQIGGYPPPDLIFPHAVMGHAGIYSGQPIYMHVPPAHAHRWNHYCSYYNACEVMVYFVQPNWYDNVYVPGSRAQIGYTPAPIYAPPPPYYYAPPRPIYRNHGHHGHHHHPQIHGGHHHGHGKHHSGGHGHRHEGHRHDHGHGRGGHDRR